MTLLQGLRSALTSLLANKMRSFLTMLGVIIGVAAVIVVVAIGEGLKADVMQRIQGLGTNLLMISPSSRRGPHGPVTRPGRLTDEDWDLILPYLEENERLFGIKIDDTLSMYYEIDNFAEPWINPETVLLVHGLSESSAVWYAWVPPLARKYATVRIDLRGFGKSSIPPEGYQWSLANFARDIKLFMDKIGLQRVHLVGAKIAGRISLQFAHDYPDRLHSLTVVNAPLGVAGRNGKEIKDWVSIIETEGIAQHTRATMKERLGDVPEEIPLTE